MEHLTFNTNAAATVKVAKIKATLYLPARSPPDSSDDNHKQ
jgi:hypothetical protein